MIKKTLGALLAMTGLVSGIGASVEASTPAAAISAPSVSATPRFIDTAVRTKKATKGPSARLQTKAKLRRDAARPSTINKFARRSLAKAAARRAS